MSEEHDSWLEKALGFTFSPPTALPRGAGNLTLTPPQLGASGKAPPGQPPAAQLHFQLTPGELAACNQYLNAHFDAVLTANAPPIAPDSYQPGLDGKPVDIPDVVHALLPLTLAGSQSKDGKDQMFKDTFSQLYDLVKGRQVNLALSKSKAALDAASKTATSDTIATSKEAEEWVKKYLQGNDLRADIAGDGTGSTVMFCNKSKPLATVIDTT